MKLKSYSMIVAVLLLVAGLVSGTLAWLTDQSNQIVNTFTTSDITVEISETKGTPVTGQKDTYKFKMIPGYTLEKDPKVTVKAGSVECWLFVQITETNNTLSGNRGKYITYEIDTSAGWTEVDDGVYARKVEAASGSNTIAEDKTYGILKDNTVKVNGAVTKADMETAETATPNLTFKAYACQLKQDGENEFDAATAWAQVKPTT